VSVSRVALLGVLVLLGLAHAAHATLGTYLRAAVVSWDSPVSQQQDELASQSLPWTDAFADTLAQTRASAGSTSRLSAATAEHAHASLALSSGITRSPPAL
jgi:hypothetical protein